MKTLKLNKKEFQMLWDAVGFWYSDSLTKTEKQTWNSLHEKMKKADIKE